MQCAYLVSDCNNKPKAVFHNLDDAINLCSKRHHLVQLSIWRNLGNEETFDDYVIFKVPCDTFGGDAQPVDFQHFEQDRYKTEIECETRKKAGILERAKSAAESLLTIERIYAEERGPNWRCNLSDGELDSIIVFEDALYEECMYEPWKLSRETCGPPYMKWLRNRLSLVNNMVKDFCNPRKNKPI